MPPEIADNGLAFGVDPSRHERFSLRQARYNELAADIADLAIAAERDGRRLQLLDIGVAGGTSRLHIERHLGATAVDHHGADIVLDTGLDQSKYKAIFLGDLMNGFPEIPDNAFDVVICEQVLEHLERLETPVRTLERVLKPGGSLFVGVPIFPLGLHLLRRPAVQLVDSVTPNPRERGHVQSFSLRSFKALLSRYSNLEIVTARGFRIISGGILRPLENQEWCWRLNRRIGAAIPGLCIETQIVARKRA